MNRETKWREVVIEATIQCVTDVLEDWDEKQINFYFNESRWCAVNIIAILDKGPSCLCEFVTIKYVRDATDEDKEAWAETSPS